MFLSHFLKTSWVKSIFWQKSQKIWQSHLYYLHVSVECFLTFLINFLFLKMLSFFLFLLCCHFFPFCFYFFSLYFLFLFFVFNFFLLIYVLFYFFLFKKLKFGPKSDFQAFCPIIKKLENIPLIHAFRSCRWLWQIFAVLLSKNISFILKKEKEKKEKNGPKTLFFFLQLPQKCSF